MKNFFKKLSFVLAVAMVLTSITPATASAAGKTFIYKSGKVSELADGYMLWVGDKGTDLNVMVNGKKNVAGTWKVGNKAIATIDKNGVVTPKANGKTTVRFTAKTGETDTLKITVGTRASSVKPYVSTDTTKTTITELEMTVGESKDIWLSLPVPSAAKKAGSTSSTFVTDTKGYDEEVLTVKKNTTRKFTFTANKAGETTITIGAGKPSNKFVKTAEIKVTVADAFAAKQTGVKKITVTGSNLTDKVADYTLKRGNVAVTLDTVELSEDKKSAVLVAASSKLPAGDYTVTFGETTSDVFKVEDGKLFTIKVSPNLVLNGNFGVASTATISYKAYNQFEEDITKTVTTLNASCTLGTAGTPDSTKGTVTVSNISSYYQLGTAGKMVMIDTAGTGISVEADITLSSKSVPAEIIISGVYDSWNKKMVDLTANKVYNGSLYLVVNAVDQYGNSIYTGLDTTSNGDVSVVVNPVLTNFSLVDTNGSTYNYDWDVFGYLIPITNVTSSNLLSAGTVTFTFVLKGVAKNVTATLEIANTAKVASIEIYPLDTVYQGERNEFGYTALDADGNEVTSYALLTDPNYGVTLPTGFYFDNYLYSGVAKLYFNGSTLTAIPEGTTGYHSAMVATSDYSFTKTVQFNYCAAARPASFIGFDTDDITLGVVTGSAFSTTPNAIAVNGTNLKIADQYGRIMSDTALAAFSSNYAIALEATVKNNSFSVATNHAITVGTASMDAIVVGTTTSAVTYSAVGADGTATFTYGLYKKNSDATYSKVASSENNVKLVSATIDQISNFSIKDLGTLAADGTGTKYAVTTRENTGVTVYGYASGIKITIPSECYQVVSSIYNSSTKKLDAASASWIGTDAGDTATTGEFDVTVVIANYTGSEVKTTVKIASEKPVVNYVQEVYKLPYITVASTSATNGLVTAITNELCATDQYGKPMGTDWHSSSISTCGHSPRVLLSDFSNSATMIPTANNTSSAVLASQPAAGSSLKATLVFDGGYTYTTVVVFE